ncbi:hypothetical protein Scep_000245 [Stephania cephalantha]|uniref:Uncharacterized protein n=1 Tax=Stephania cephalantha TaxID=152367 RepID=A0AAP0Q3Y7_9MAGN
MASVAHGTHWVKDQTGPLGQRLPTWRPRDLGPLQLDHLKWSFVPLNQAFVRFLPVELLQSLRSKFQQD